MNKNSVKEMKSSDNRDRDYLNPDFKVLMPTKRGVGIYEELRYNYLKENKKELFNELFFQGKLNDHLAVVEKSARNRLDQIIRCLLMKHPAPDKKLKPISWVEHMNNMKTLASEIVILELIYN